MPPLPGGPPNGCCSCWVIGEAPGGGGPAPNGICCCGPAEDEAGGPVTGPAFGSPFGFGVWNSTTHNLQLQDPSGGDVSAGDKQYM